MPNTSESDFLVRVDRVTGLFSTRTGGTFSADTSQVYNGGEDFATTIVGKKKADELVVTRPYQPERDQRIITELQKRVGSFRTTISQQPQQVGGMIIGNPTTWPDALLTRVTPPEANNGSSSGAMMELRFAVSQVV